MISCPPELLDYPGSKGLEGVYHRIIGQMPPHTHYVEAFVGGGAIFRHKKPASRTTTLIDIDPRVVKAWRQHLRGMDNAPMVLEGDFIAMDMSGVLEDRDTVLYCDPPYLESTRTRLFYRHELASEFDHLRLLQYLLTLRCRVMLSGYDSRLYNDLLGYWRKVSYQTMTRGGPRTECLWLNFPEPALIHDVRYAGNGYRENERIKKLRTRWVARLRRMSQRDRQVVLEALEEVGR